MQSSNIFGRTTAGLAPAATQFAVVRPLLCRYCFPAHRDLVLFVSGSGSLYSVKRSTIL